MSGFKSQVDTQKIKELTDKNFSDSIVESLKEYIRIPNLSPNFDLEWNSNGLLEKAANHLKDWVVQQQVQGLKLEILKNSDAPPLIFITIDRTDDSDKNILMYGHFDKQPHFQGWKEGTGPTTPVIIGDLLYGRGGADDGYAIYSSVLCIKQCQVLGYKHPRITIVIEGEEESGSKHFFDYFNKIHQQHLPNADLLICLDSGAVNYNTMWLTNSLRGNIVFQLKVSVLEAGQHSGSASGIVPSPFRIVRKLLDRIENPETGEIIQLLHTNIPENRQKEIKNLAQQVGDEYLKQFPFHQNTQPLTKDVEQAITNRTWGTFLTVTGIDGLPSCQLGGNVIGQSITIKCSCRVSPIFDSKNKEIQQKLKQILTENPPYGCTVEYLDEKCTYNKGFNAKDMNPELQQSLNEASIAFYGKEMMGQGEGGGIPLITQFQSLYKDCNIIVTGVLGPGSNAHGPNETLNIPYCQKLTACMTKLVADFSLIFKQK